MVRRSAAAGGTARSWTSPSASIRAPVPGTRWAIVRRSIGPIRATPSRPPWRRPARPIGPAEIARISGLKDEVVKQRLAAMVKAGRMHQSRPRSVRASLHIPVTSVTSVTLSLQR